jgi:hypothetical protein
MAVAVPASRVTDLATLIRAEYEEMPYLHLTRAQVQRLWLLDPSVCDDILRRCSGGRSSVWPLPDSYGGTIMSRRRAAHLDR